MRINKQQAEQKLASILPDDIKTLSTIFIKNGFQLFLVGGAVRDILMSKQPKDFDVCTDAMPFDVERILKEENITTEAIGEHFGVIAAMMSDMIEIATFRTDKNNSTDRNTDVILGVTINDDVQRRDLTINALFFDIQNSKIIDLVGGLDDMKNEIIRTVGNADQRFEEDNIRKIRCVRFAARTGFKIETNTFHSIQLNASLNVVNERIVNELTNTFNTSINKQKTIECLIKTNLLREIFPNLNINENFNIDLCFNFTTFIAEIFKNNDVDNVVKELTDRQFTTELINGVSFLFKFTTTDNIQPIDFQRAIRSTSLSPETLAKFTSDDKFIDLCKFTLPLDTAKTLMDKGFTGVVLGQKIKEIAFNLFHTI